MSCVAKARPCPWDVIDIGWTLCPWPKSRFGAKSTLPPIPLAGRKSATARAPLCWSTESRSETRRSTGIPWFSRMKPTFVEKPGGASGGAIRVTTDRERKASGGRSIGPWRPPGIGIRIEPGVGRNGSGPWMNGAEASPRMIAASRTKWFWTYPPPTKVSCLTACMKPRFMKPKPGGTGMGGRWPHQGENGSLGPIGNQPTCPPMTPCPGGPPAKTTRAGE